MEVVIFKIITHILLSLALLALFRLPASLSVITAISIGTALPDADNLLIFIGRLTNNTNLSGYKTLTHSMLGLIIFSVPSIILFSPAASGSIILGYCVHIITDLFFSEGCNLLYPFKNEKRNLASFKFMWPEELIFSIIFLSIFISYILQ